MTNLHAWHCSCGSRNPTEHTSCRRCGALPTGNGDWTKGIHPAVIVGGLFLLFLMIPLPAWGLIAFFGLLVWIGTGVWRIANRS